jgi:sec-independent protein translocase protein TatC
MARDPREMDFFEHLEELRNRMLRSLAYLIVGMIVAWFVREQIFNFVRQPLAVGMSMVTWPEGQEPKLMGPQVTTGFVFAFQVALFGGLLFAFPLILLEAWLFIEPALLDHERKYALVVLPFALALFAGGVAFCYKIAPVGIAFLLKFQKGFEMTPLLNLADYMRFIMRLFIIFGLVFQLPLVLMFLSFVGLVSSDQLIQKWRYAVVAIFVVAAVATPTTDPFTMTIMAGPVIVLYGLSIILARLVERARRRREAAEAEAERKERAAARRATQAKALPKPAEPAGQTGEPVEAAEALEAEAAAEPESQEPVSTEEEPPAEEAGPEEHWQD